MANPDIVLRVRFTLAGRFVFWLARRRWLRLAAYVADRCPLVKVEV